ncbi:hypothetical protein RJ639_030993 [Escallonia herrerae]|uniref:Uncharacterized protein n=1 Tax=Escallonia herrerae TaxID=1293975 RepID=A0AA88WYD5_9ASTE|nr:hypothetical protein RJ639_030993 [Escallonia herrerae]
MGFEPLPFRSLDQLGHLDSDNIVGTWKSINEGGVLCSCTWHDGNVAFVTSERDEGGDMHCGGACIMHSGVHVADIAAV